MRFFVWLLVLLVSQMKEIATYLYADGHHPVERGKLMHKEGENYLSKGSQVRKRAGLSAPMAGLIKTKHRPLPTRTGKQRM